MCKSKENEKLIESQAEPPSPLEKLYSVRIAKLQRLVDIQEEQKDHLKHEIAGLRKTIKELMSR